MLKNKLTASIVTLNLKFNHSKKTSTRTFCVSNNKTPTKYPPLQNKNRRRNHQTNKKQTRWPLCKKTNRVARLFSSSVHAVFSSSAASFVSSKGSEGSLPRGEPLFQRRAGVVVLHPQKRRSLSLRYVKARGKSPKSPL